MSIHEIKAQLSLLIRETEEDLHHARSAQSPRGQRRFLEFDALVARVRLRALQEALLIIMKQGGDK